MNFVDQRINVRIMSIAIPVMCSRTRWICMRLGTILTLSRKTETEPRGDIYVCACVCVCTFFLFLRLGSCAYGESVSLQYDRGDLQARDLSKSCVQVQRQSADKPGRADIAD